VGRAIALALANAGYDVAVTFLNTEPKEKFKAIRIDLTQPNAADEIYRAITTEFGRLDILVNNASIYEPGEEPALAKRMWTIHYETPRQLCRAFEKELRAARGHVVNMLDILAEKPWPRFMAYCASKAALWNLTLSMAKELAPEVTVNGIAPGVVEWPADYPQSEKEKYLGRVPLGCAGTPEDVAGAVLYFCRAQYVTGNILRLDGGRSLT